MRGIAVVALSGLLGVTLVGCGAAQTAATAQQQPSVPGVNAGDAGIAVRNALVEFSPDGYPTGGDAPIQMRLINETDQAVRLTEAVSPAARSVTVQDAVAVVLPQEPEPTAPADPLAEQPPADGAAAAIGPGGFVEATLQLTGLTGDLGPAGEVALELRFDNGAVIPLTVPVAPPGEPVPRGEELDVGHH